MGVLGPMEIRNRELRYSAPRSESWLLAVSKAVSSQLDPEEYPLRFSIVGVTNDEFVIEATTVKFDSDEPYADRLRTIELLDPRPKTHQSARFGVVQIIPTGVRCAFGGYAGDGTPVTNLLASVADFVVTHPNAVNASELNELAPNVLYVEGKSLDDFLLGHLGLCEVTSNRIGTFVDPTGIDYIDDVIDTLNAARAVKGIDCAPYTILASELGVRIGWSASGCAVGTILDPTVMLAAVELLLSHGVAAIGGVSVIHGVTAEMFSRHMAGEIPNPSGGVEAILTHLISKIFRIPTAHAPLPYYRDIKDRTTRDPRASAEFISTPHYFSVLKGLFKSPRVVALANLDNAPAHLVTVNNIGAIVMPSSCLGGLPALAAEFSDIPLIAVRENTTVLAIDNEKMRMRNVIEVQSYLEAVGVVAALRAGISIESLRRPLAGATLIEPQRTALVGHSVVGR